MNSNQEIGINMITLEVGNVVVASTRNESSRFYSTEQTQTTTVDNNNDGDDLDFLVDNLSASNPTFAALLNKTAKEFAPLALTDDGQVTITSLRMSAGLTQKKLAEEIGQKQSNVSLIESGQRDNIQRDTMRMMCNAFSCDMNTLDLALENSKTMLLDLHGQQDSRACSIKDDASRKSA